MSTSNLIPRTCTEVTTDDSARVSIVGPQPLSAFRDVPAYVLLGEPGAGKTTEFEQECHALGDAAACIQARAFRRASGDQLRKLRGKILYIDGLDETRARGAYGTDAVDEIQAKLLDLEPPAFRISCRVADWFGPVDRSPFEYVAADGRIVTLQLDRFSRSDARLWLEARSPVIDAATFLLEASNHGFDSMLESPQWLAFLYESVVDGSWPATRSEAFRRACERLVSEPRDDHPHAAEIVPAQEVMNTASRVFATQLLSGSAGIAFGSSTRSEDFIAASDIASDLATSAELSANELRRVIATGLFKSPDDQCYEPVHRQVAEYLGASHLADLIGRRVVSVGRVCAAMTSPVDSRVVTDMRGLAAWLGTHSAPARSLLIEADPVGVALYGDISEWPVQDRRALLDCLLSQTRPEDLWGIRWFDRTEGRYRDSTAWSFRSLCKPDMVDTLEEYLGRAQRDAVPSHILEFLLRSLTETEDYWRDQLHNLLPHVGQIAREVTTEPDVRLAALLAFARIEGSESAVTATLSDALDAVRDSRFADPDDDIAGSLLSILYPHFIAPGRIWTYASLMHHGTVRGESWNFWRHVLCDETPSDELANLLDGFADDAERLWPLLASGFAEEVPWRLLVRALLEIGDKTEPERLYRWIAATTSQRPRTGTDEIADLHEWFRTNDATTRQLLRISITRSTDNEVGRVERNLRRELLLAAPPPNFVEWCVQQARAQAAIDWGVACAFLKAPLRYGHWLGETDDALIERLRSALANDPQLLGHLDEYLTPSATQLEVQAEERRHQQEIDEIRAEHEQKRQQRQADWRALLRDSRDELATNCFPATNLHTLAMAYLGRLVLRADLDDPRDRVAELIGDNAELLDTVMNAMRDAPMREDVPSVERTAELIAESKHDWLAYPVLAGLTIRESESSLDDDTLLSDDTKRNTLAIYAAVALMPSQKPAWPERWLSADPKLVLDVLHRCSVAAVRNGDTHLAMLYWLDEVDGLDDELRDFRLRLLRSISVRLPVAQLPIVDRLLQLVSEHPDTAPLKELVAQKLRANSMTDTQRVRWMTLDAIMGGGDALRLLDDFIGTNAKSARQLAEFLPRGFHRPAKFVDRLLGDDRCATLHTLVGIIGRNFPPRERRNGEAVTIGPAETMAYLVEQWINDLGGQPTEEAGAAFDGLIADERLSAWHDQLEYARNRQGRLHLDASYAPMNVADVLGLLRNGPPANVADLHVLLSDRLRDLGSHIQGDNSDPWRQFWADDRESQPSEPKHERSCRDALLAMLRSLLPEGVDAQPEGQYAADRQADIRVTFKDYNVPVEIKKNTHPDLWTAIDDQLTAKYTTDPATGGYGIYLVLWLGADAPGYPRHPTDRDRPSTPDELEHRLYESMSHEQRRTISAVVLDVTKP